MDQLSLAGTHWCIYSKSNNLFPYMPLNFNRFHSLYGLEEISVWIQQNEFLSNCTLVSSETKILSQGYYRL